MYRGKGGAVFEAEALWLLSVLEINARQNRRQVLHTVPCSWADAGWMLAELVEGSKLKTKGKGLCRAALRLFEPALNIHNPRATRYDQGEIIRRTLVPRGFLTILPYGHTRADRGCSSTSWRLATPCFVLRSD